MATTPTAAPATKPLKVLYLFSGTPRRLDMATCLQQLAGAWTLNLKTECVDVKRSAKHDLSLAKVRQSYLNRIAAREFDAVLLSPPCASFSRAPWANFRGPRPVRSYDSPRGLQTLTPAERDRAILGNIFADFSYEVATLVADGAATFFAMEQPEDLGALASGPHEGLRPASMWQWPTFSRRGYALWRFTRLALAPPMLSRHASCCGHRYPCQTVSMKECLAMTQKAATLVHCPLLRVMGLCSKLRQATGAFRTSGSEQWPAKLCQWLSAMLVSTCLRAANAAVGEGDHASPVETLPPSTRGRPGAGWDGPPPFLPPARGGETFPRWGRAMLAWQVAPPCQELCRWPPVSSIRWVLWNS